MDHKESTRAYGIAEVEKRLGEATARMLFADHYSRASNDMQKSLLEDAFGGRTWLYPSELADQLEKLAKVGTNKSRFGNPKRKLSEDLISGRRATGVWLGTEKAMMARLFRSQQDLPLQRIAENAILIGISPEYADQYLRQRGLVATKIRLIEQSSQSQRVDLLSSGSHRVELSTVTFGAGMQIANA